MKKNAAVKKIWKNAKNVSDMKRAVDVGQLATWKEARSAAKLLSPEESSELSVHFAQRFCEDGDERLYLELLAESYLVFTANSMDEKAVNAFLDCMMAHPRHIDAIRSFVEICLTSETTDHAHDVQVYALAVALICEIGIRVSERIGKDEGMEEVSRHVTTYLLSVSNQNNTSIRLSLLNYFGRISILSQANKKAFERMMSRFGHTVLDQLFSMLFAKKSESVALLYLCENLPYIFSADNHSQRIIHETFRFHLLKKPERFVLFLNHFSEILRTQETVKKDLLRVYLQHLTALYGVISELNHKNLAREITGIIGKFQELDIAQELIRDFVQKNQMKPYFDQLFRSMFRNSTIHRESLLLFHSAKRGRRPSFSKAPVLSTFGQVHTLGTLEVSKAS